MGYFLFHWMPVVRTDPVSWFWFLLFCLGISTVEPDGTIHSPGHGQHFLDNTAAVNLKVFSDWVWKQNFSLLNVLLSWNQVLTYAQQSKEVASIEQDKLAKRIQEFRTQVELDNLRSSSNMEASTNGDGIHVVGVGSDKSIEALMQSTANGKVPY